MPIEFQCTSCQQTLRVKDEFSGKNARCPNCQSVVQIPSQTSAEVDPLFGTPPATQPPNQFPQLGQTPAKYGGSAPHNPYAAPAYAPTGKENDERGNRGTIRPTAVTFSDIFDPAMKVWQQNLGLLVGVTVVIMIFNGLSNVIHDMIIDPMILGNGDPFMVFGMSLTISSGTSLIGLFLGIGASRIYLNLARGREARFEQLFSGGDKFLPVLGASIIAGICLVLGFLFLIIPGIILALLFWPYYLLIVDGKTGVMDSFGMAYRIGKENVGTTFVMAFAAIGISILGFLALCIGIIFAAPLISMIYVVAYLKMSGQRVAR